MCLMGLHSVVCAVLSPRVVLDEIWDLNESVPENFPAYFYPVPGMFFNEFHKTEHSGDLEIPLSLVSGLLETP